MAIRTVRDPNWKSLIGDMVRARDAVEREDFDDASIALLKLRADLESKGVRSAHVAWSLAITSDGQGDLEKALDYICEALELDPLALPYQRSYDVIIERIRKMLGNEERSPVDATTPRIYEVLMRAGECDATSHLAMARWHFHAGDHRSSMRLLEALTTLNPSLRLGWQWKARVARALGDDKTATEADFESAALEGYEAMPFAFPPKALG